MMKILTFSNIVKGVASKHFLGASPQASFFLHNVLLTASADAKKPGQRK